jgi:hypothetical protein
MLGGCSGASTPSRPQPSTSVPSVDVNATPPGWVPVDYRDAQISVPKNWDVSFSPCPGPAPGTVFLHSPGPAYFCPNAPSNPTMAWIYSMTTPPPTEIPTVVNGIDTYPIEGSPALGGYQIPSLGLQVEVEGPLANEVLQTLTYSPRFVTLAAGSLAPPTPDSWHRISFGGISAEVPKAWRITHSAPIDCEPGLLNLGERAVFEVSGTEPIAVACPATTFVQVEEPTDGLLINPGPYGPLTSSTTYGRCFKAHGLSVCPTTSDIYGVLVTAVHLPRHSRPVAVEIGLAGDGSTARTILDSLQAR